MLGSQKYDDCPILPKKEHAKETEDGTRMGVLGIYGQEGFPTEIACD
jgi:hypothetical protein